MHIKGTLTRQTVGKQKWSTLVRREERVGGVWSYYPHLQYIFIRKYTTIRYSSIHNYWKKINTNMHANIWLFILIKCTINTVSHLLLHSTIHGKIYTRTDTPTTQDALITNIRTDKLRFSSWTSFPQILPWNSSCCYYERRV